MEQAFMPVRRPIVETFFQSGLRS